MTSLTAAATALRRQLQKQKQAPRHRSLGPARLHRIEVELGRTPVLTWLQCQPAEYKFYWQERDHNFEMAGLGKALHLTVKPANLEPKFRAMRALLPEPPSDVRFYGGLAFPGRNSWPGFGAGQFLVPAFELVRKRNRFFLASHWLMEADIDRRLLELDRIRFHALPGTTAAWESPERRDAPDFPAFGAVFRKAQRRLDSGQLDKIVLARATRLRFREKQDPWEWLQQLLLKPQPVFGFGFQPTVGKAFIGCTPELLYSRQGRAVSLEALAGTRPRGQRPEEDAQFRRSLSASRKERHEHRLVADHVQAAMAALGIQGGMAKPAQVHLLKHLQHLRTVFRGRFQGPASDAALIAALHPTPAVGGWPAREALERLREWDPFARGWYAGLIGWAGSDSARFAVGIRSARFTGNVVQAYAGVGVVKASVLADEWQELENKIEPFTRLLEK